MSDHVDSSDDALSDSQPEESCSSEVTTSTLLNVSDDDPNTATLRDVDEFEHVVQFYDTQEFLLNVLANFIAPIMITPDAAIVIATKTRLEALEESLRERGLPAEEKKRKGQLVLIDAHEMLDMLTGCGEASSISIQSLEIMLQKLDKQFAKLYVYGELVNLLCEQGDHSAAVKLEEMWNGLVKRYKLTLLCGYDINNFKEENLNDAFKAVCCTHSRVGPSEDYSDPGEQDTLIAMLQQKAKVLETEIERRKAVETTLAHYFEILSTRAEESLRHQQELYHTLLSILPVGVYSAPMTADGEDAFVNQRFCELSGLSEDDVRAHGWFTAVHLDDRDSVRHLWDISNQTSFGGKEEYRYVLPDGNIRWVTGETVQFTSHKGKAQTYVHTIVDITQLKEVEKQRAEASQKAEELLRNRVEQVERHKMEQDQFIDTLCHELRNPLSSIHGNVELLHIGLDIRQSILASDHATTRDIQRLREQWKWDQESIMAIEKCVAHQKVITDDVLNLSKLEVGKVVLRNVEFNPKDVMMEVTKMFEAEANRKGITLRCNIPVSDVIVKADPDRVSQVLINLLANALKFTTQGCITLGLDIEQEEKTGRILVRSTVKDTGIGLTKQEKAKLFHRFMQPASTSYDEVGGSGLGLVISKGLVELMGGTISVESAKGQGSEFIFTFTSEEVEHRRCAWPAPSPVSPLYRTRHIRKILVVEDNVINQQFLTRLLNLARFECKTAANGLEALTCVERELFDLILMDVHMPIMDGIASTREIRAREAKLSLKPVVIVGLSGNAREEHQLHAISSGMDCYLTKPCRKEDLYGVIERFDQHW